MNLRHLHLQGFMSHQDTALDFPETGAVTVRGANGSGKSSIAEAVSWGLWGRTLRGTDPVGPEGACTVIVETDTVRVTRSRKGRKNSLEWHQHGTPAVPWENNTKAQAALEAIIGTHNTWRRTAVFSSSDASRFTGATDGERKRFLEGLLGLDRFDRALAAARNDLRAAEQSKALLARDMGAAEQRQALYAQSAREHREALSSAPAPPTGTQAHIDALTAALRTQRDCLGDIEEDISELIALRATDAASLRSLEAAAARLAAAECPTCAQPIPDDLRRDVSRAATKQRSMIAMTAGQMRTRIATANTSRDTIRNEAEQMRQRRADIIAARAEYDNWRERTAQMQARVDESALSTAKVAKEVAGLAIAIAEDEQRALELKAVEQVLGLKGVRAQLTAATLTAISHTANAWLSRIAGPGLSLKLRPYSERKSGGVNDAISLEIEGAGGGHGYKAASGGERRRIDLALLFALAEVAAAASGGQRGTIFADEVFDALDADGMTAAAQVLEELSADRAVVVITHAGVPVRAVAHWTVEAGEVITT